MRARRIASAVAQTSVLYNRQRSLPHCKHTFRVLRFGLRYTCYSLKLIARTVRVNRCLFYFFSFLSVPRRWFRYSFTVRSFLRIVLRCVLSIKFTQSPHGVLRVFFFSVVSSFSEFLFGWATHRHPPARQHAEI